VKKSRIFWVFMGLFIVFLAAIFISADINKEVVDYTDYEQGTIVQTSDGIRVDGNWYYFDEWSLKWSKNNPVLTKKGTHSFLGDAEVWVGFLCGFAAFGTGVYAYYLHEMEKKADKEV